MPVALYLQIVGSENLRYDPMRILLYFRITNQVVCCAHIFSAHVPARAFYKLVVLLLIAALVHREQL